MEPERDRERIPIERLLFIYAADGGKMSAWIDSAKKLLRLKGCTLCSLTHGLTGEKAEWRECKDELGVAVDYVHRDELTPAMREVVGGRLPCILAQAEGKLSVLLDPAALERCQGSVPDLRGRLRAHAAMAGLALPS
jgi:hypothetical protein